MGKRHQASRRKAYGRRQHELRERFDRSGLHDDQLTGVEVYATPAYADARNAFGAFDLAVSGGLRFALRD